jgi:hypothetical protein
LKIVFKSNFNLQKGVIYIVKKLLNLLIIVFFSIMISNSVEAQRRSTNNKNVIKENVDEENFKSVLSFGLTTNTNSGLLGGAAVRKEILINNNAFHRQFHYINFEVVSVNHYRESTSNVGGNGSGYVYGKQNYLFAIRPQYGREINLFRKSSEGGVNVNGIIAGGPTIGLLKPYYVQVFYGRGTVRDEIFDPKKHTPNNIAGSGGFFEGLGEATVVPGVNLKAALNFELDAFRQSNISLEIGFLAEAYTQKVNIMALSENRNLYTSGYITIFFGGKK